MFVHELCKHLVKVTRIRHKPIYSQKVNRFFLHQEISLGSISEILQGPDTDRLQTFEKTMPKDKGNQGNPNKVS